MTLSMNLRIVGILLVLLGLSHAFFSRYFGWERELAERVASDTPNILRPQLLSSRWEWC